VQPHHFREDCDMYKDSLVQAVGETAWQLP